MRFPVSYWRCARRNRKRYARPWRDNIERKLRVQPVRSWSAGCVFKNPPEGTSAGKLLDEAGFRGKRLGGMCFSEIHANFLVNEGKGSADARA